VQYMHPLQAGVLDHAKVATLRHTADHIVLVVRNPTAASNHAPAPNSNVHW
jgi:hypothetical protein